MKFVSGLCWAAGLICAPLAVLLCGCGEPITPDDGTAEVLLPSNALQYIQTTAEAVTTAETTTVTLNPAWQENVVENYNYSGGAVIKGVPHYTQFTSYQTACESLAAVSLLQYYGVGMDIDRFIDSYLPMADYPVNGEDGELHGASPWEYFIGDPRDPGGFGCYNTCIETALNKLQKGLAVALRDVPLKKLCSDYIDKGQPVMFWGTINMATPYVSEFYWIIPDGTTYYFVNPEHACLLIGYDDNYYYFSDSMSYTEITPYAKWQVEAAYEGLFRQALVIDPLVLETLPDFWRTETAKSEIIGNPNGVMS